MRYCVTNNMMFSSLTAEAIGYCLFFYTFPFSAFYLSYHLFTHRIPNGLRTTFIPRSYLFRIFECLFPAVLATMVY